MGIDRGRDGQRKGCTGVTLVTLYPGVYIRLTPLISSGTLLQKGVHGFEMILGMM